MPVPPIPPAPPSYTAKWWRARGLAKLRKAPTKTSCRNRVRAELHNSPCIHMFPNRNFKSVPSYTTERSKNRFSQQRTFSHFPISGGGHRFLVRGGQRGEMNGAREAGRCGGERRETKNVDGYVGAVAACSPASSGSLAQAVPTLHPPPSYSPYPPSLIIHSEQYMPSGRKAGSNASYSSRPHVDETERKFVYCTRRIVRYYT